MSDSFVHLHVHTEYSMLDGAARLKELFAEASRLGMPALAMTDHGNLFGAYDFYKQATAAGRQADHRPRGLSHARHRRLRAHPGALGRRRRERRLRRRRLHPHDACSPPTPTGLHNLFRLGSRASLEGYFYKPRADRELLQPLRQGAHRHHRLPVRRDPDLAAASATSTRRCEVGRGVPRHLRRRTTSSSSSWTTGSTSRPGSGTACCASASGSTSRRWPPTTCTTRTRTTPTRTRCCSACSPARRWPTRTASSSTRAASTSSPPTEMRKLWDSEVPGACDTTLEIAERIGDYSSVFAARNLMPQFPVPAGETEESLAAQGGHARASTGASPAACRRATASRRSTSSTSSARWASRATSWSSPTSCAYAKREGIRVGPGPRLGGRLR